MKAQKKLSESAFQKQVIDLAHLYCWRAAHFRPAQVKDGRWVTPVAADGKGFPDLLLLRGSQQIVAELKVGRNKPSLEQEAWLAAFQLAGVEAHVWRPQDWKSIEEALSK